MADDFLVTDEDLAYMREEQTLTRPTACTLTPKTNVISDGRGGTKSTPGNPEPIQARVVTGESQDFRRAIPQDLADRYGVSVMVRIHLDLAPVAHPGDILTEEVGGRKYEVVSDGSIRREWATDQTVWGVAR